MGEKEFNENSAQGQEELTDVEADLEEAKDLSEENEEASDNLAEDVEVDASSLKEENQALQAELDEIKDRILRIQAEYENYRKRTEKERVSARKYEAEALATELLPVIDNFERALLTEVDEKNKGFYDGVKMVYEQFLTALHGQGVEVMKVENEPFDPNLHHAVMQEEDDSVESNTVTEELQKGYLLKDKVIRPAMVKVNK